MKSLFARHPPRPNRKEHKIVQWPKSFGSEPQKRALILLNSPSSGSRDFVYNSSTGRTAQRRSVPMLNVRALCCRRQSIGILRLELRASFRDVHQSVSSLSQTSTKRAHGLVNISSNVATSRLQPPISRDGNP